MSHTNKKPRKRAPKTPQAQKVIEKILADCFDQSQLKLSKGSGLAVSAVSRLMKGRRSATPEQIGLIVGAVPKVWALKLMEAYLSDVAAATKAPGFIVTVSK